MVRNPLDEWQLDNLDFLFIENCRQSGLPFFEVRVVLLNRRRGQPLKYPTIFDTADVAVITKTDLAQAIEFDASAAHRNIQAVRPGMEVFEVSAKTGSGVSEWLRFLTVRKERSCAEMILRPSASKV